MILNEDILISDMTTRRLSCLILAIFVAHREWVNLVMVSARRFYEHPHCTNGDIVSFPFLPTN